MHIYVGVPECAAVGGGDYVGLRDEGDVSVLGLAHHGAPGHGRPEECIHYCVVLGLPLVI
jgi:hypothetical protein